MRGPRPIPTLIFAFLLCMAGPPPTPVLAEITQAEDGKRKINLSGRQRMLSQRMAKAACFASLGIEPDRHRAMAREAHELFDRTLTALRHGSTEQGIEAEQHRLILDELDRVDDLWRIYGSAVLQAVEDRTAPSPQVPEVARLSIPTLEQMDATVTMFERHHGAHDIHPALALAINISGRQRMLTQKAGKEFCLVAHGHDVAGNRQTLVGTLALFDRSLAALRHGSDEMGLPPAPTDALVSQLALVQDLWAPLSTIFSRISTGGVPTAEEIAHVARGNDEVLQEVGRAVEMYEAL